MTVSAQLPAVSRTLLAGALACAGGLAIAALAAMAFVLFQFELGTYAFAFLVFGYGGIVLPILVAVLAAASLALPGHKRVRTPALVAMAISIVIALSFYALTATYLQA